MRRTLMVAAAVAAFVAPLVAPVVVQAQDSANGGNQDGHVRGNHVMRERPQRTAPSNGGESHAQRPAPAHDGESRPQTRQRPDTPTPTERPDRSQHHDRPGGGATRPDRGGHSDGGPTHDNRQDRPQRPDRPNRPDRPDRSGQNGGWTGRDGRDGDRNGGNGGWTGRNGGQDHTHRPDRPDRGDHDGSGRPDRGDHNGGRGDRDHDRREFHNRFNGDQWRRDWTRRHGNDWWRQDRRFRGFTGVRFGFYFAPGYGYYSVPRSYFGQRWHEGDYLPSIFWRYSLNDWQSYGLGYPPPGTRWVWVDNSIYLIDAFDGYIIDVVYDAWRW